MKKYNVIYADPPWSYTQKSAGRGNKSGAADMYKTSPLQILKEMPIEKMADDNAVLFMWGTVPLLPEAIELLAAWGFRYKTKITWEKTGLLGMGNWLRVQEEYILVGIRGRVKPFSHQEKNIYKHPVCEHSAKPHFFRELVLKLANKSFNHCEKLELFARSRAGFFPDYEYEGWDVYGNQVNGSIELPTDEPSVATGDASSNSVD
jgi:N6-adenosine-specific RNA methylase IME4